jgi:hypothetical protein
MVLIPIAPPHEDIPTCLKIDVNNLIWGSRMFSHVKVPISVGFRFAQLIGLNLCKGEIVKFDRGRKVDSGNKFVLDNMNNPLWVGIIETFETDNSFGCEGHDRGDSEGDS